MSDDPLIDLLTQWQAEHDDGHAWRALKRGLGIGQPKRPHRTYDVTAHHIRYIRPCPPKTVRWSGLVKGPPVKARVVSHRVRSGSVLEDELPDA